MALLRAQREVQPPWDGDHVIFHDAVLVHGLEWKESMDQVCIGAPVAPEA